MDQAHEKKQSTEIYMDFKIYMDPKHEKNQKSKKIQNANHSCMDIKYYLKKIKTEQVVPIYGDGSNQMAFILNQDIAKCLVHLLEQPYHPVINLAYNYYITQAEFAQLIADKLALPVTLIPLQPFERAIKEAFTSSIKLGTELTDCASILYHPSPEEKLTAFIEEI